MSNTLITERFVAYLTPEEKDLLRAISKHNMRSMNRQVRHMIHDCAADMAAEQAADNFNRSLGLDAGE
jgi:predicted transcriptional regulator